MMADDPTCRLMRWRLRLSLLDFMIIHQLGRKYKIPEELSTLRYEN